MGQKIKNVGTFTHGPREGFVSEVKGRLDNARWGFFRVGQSVTATERYRLERAVSYLDKENTRFDRLKVDYWMDKWWPQIWPSLENAEKYADGDADVMVECVAEFMCDRLARWRVGHLIKMGTWKPLPTNVRFTLKARDCEEPRGY